MNSLLDNTDSALKSTPKLLAHSSLARAAQLNGKLRFVARTRKPDHRLLQKAPKTPPVLKHIEMCVRVFRFIFVHVLERKEEKKKRKQNNDNRSTCIFVTRQCSAIWLKLQIFRSQCVRVAQER